MWEAFHPWVGTSSVDGICSRTESRDISAASGLVVISTKTTSYRQKNMGSASALSGLTLICNFPPTPLSSDFCILPLLPLRVHGKTWAVILQCDPAAASSPLSSFPCLVHLMVPWGDVTKGPEIYREMGLSWPQALNSQVTAAVPRACLGQAGVSHSSPPWI